MACKRRIFVVKSYIENKTLKKTFKFTLSIAVFDERSRHFFCFVFRLRQIAPNNEILKPCIVAKYVQYFCSHMDCSCL
jgi:hypothetical protein